MNKVHLKIAKAKQPGRRAEWWITGIPGYHVDEEGPYESCGPYYSFQDAKSDKDGMARTFNQERWR